MGASDPQNLRLQFRLPAEDEAFLNSLGLPWETLAVGGQRWIVIYDVNVPTGYNHEVVDVAIMMAPGYPPGPLDMAYIHPCLVRLTGQEPVCAGGRVQIDNRSWQAWSRHRTAENPWVPGEDCLESHYLYILGWFEAELAR